jgi:hypothetical protein
MFTTHNPPGQTFVQGSFGLNTYRARVRSLNGLVVLALADSFGVVRPPDRSDFR